MNILTRRVLYLCVMPTLFILNVMVTLTWFNTTIVLAVLCLFVMLLRVSDRGVHFVSMNEWIKDKAIILFPDIYETGLMPNERTLLVCIPAIVAMLVNIPLSGYAQ